MIYYLSKEPFNFKTFKTMKSLGENIYSSKITMNKANEEQSDLIEHILNFNNKAGTKNRYGKKFFVFLNTAKSLYDDIKLVINAFKSRLFPLKSATGTRLKILTPTLLLQRLPIGLAQVKAGNNSENLLNGIRQLFILCINQKKSLKKYTIT